MKATIRTWGTSVILAGLLATSTARAQAPAARLALTWGLAATGQAEADEDAPADPRGDAAALLREARAAMQEGDLDQAQDLLQRAERLDVKFSLLQSLGDTPKKVRRDLEKLRAAQRKRGQLPSERMAPTAQPAAPLEQTPVATDATPTSIDDATGLMTDRQGTAKIILRQARQALAEGNIPAAVHYYRQLVSQNVQFGPNDDSLAKLAADIRAAGGKIDVAPTTASLDPSGRREELDPNEIPTDEGHPLGPVAAQPAEGSAPGASFEGFPEESPFGGEMSTEPPADPNAGLTLPGQFKPRPAVSMGDARSASDKLLVEARLALAVGDMDRAARSIEQAQQLNVEYGYHEDQPAKVAQTLERYRLLMASRGNHGRSDGYRRQHAQFLLDEAVALLAWNQFDTAERLAYDAERLQVSFAPFELSPKKVLEQVAQARRQPQGAASTAPANAAGGVVPAMAETPAGDPAAAYGAQAIYQPQSDATYVAPTAQNEPLYPDDAVAPTDAIYDPAAGDAPVTDAIPTDGLPLPGAAPSLSQPLREPTTADALAEPVAPPSGGPATNPYATPSSEPVASPVQAPPAPAAVMLVEWGAKSLAAGDFPQARAYFQEAARRRGELDAAATARLDQYLRQLDPAPGEVSQTAQPGSLIPDATAEQKVLANKVAIELGRREAAARNLAEREPQQALALLQEARAMVEAAGLDTASRDILLRRVDRLIGELNQYIERNKPLVELKERNRAVEEELEREMNVKLQSQQKLAELVEEFNTLVDQERFAEAIVVARKANELMPNEPIVQQLMQQGNFIHRHRMNLAVRGEKENGFLNAMASVDESSTPFDDRNPISFGDRTKWGHLTQSRLKMQGRDGLRRSEKDIEIEQRLRTPVSLNFKDAPLAEVLDYLGKVAQVNIYLDPQGLAEEGVTTDDPVTINLTQDVQLRSALRLILEPKRLAYVIKDEVLKITSVQMKDGELLTVNYGVADLVIPIPNFIPSSDMGLAGSLRDAYGNVGFGANPGMGSTSPLMVAASANGGSSNAAVNPNVLAQLSPQIGGGGPAATGTPQNIGFGPGGAGGGAQADFDSLIELITSTIAPTTWDEVGGPGSIKPFDTNLSLVVSQTQEVHEQIVDLLEQLRRLQDLQVTIEVRFITLNDNFFERIGVDFDFDIDDDIDRRFQVFGKPLNPALNNDDATLTERDLQDRDHGKSVTVGQAAPGVFSADLDIPFRQDSFALAVPQFGGFDAAAGASLGFAILSDLEAFFFINAAQGDRRSNVLQAPKVTLFNGQAAFVSDTSQSPFVISVIPVVGDFAAAQQPVIVVLSEGTFLTVQAVISSDRRFVRLTVVPFFSQIGDVDTFTFEGSSTTTEESESEGPDDDPTSQANSKTTITSGTTVQLPTFSFVTVTTTVSVPDGGTVLLGGIKRLSEGRNEFGVPMLNKLPYINRLFKNVGIGRETQSLMMMVTPRIIIQEEEEALLGIAPTP